MKVLHISTSDNGGAGLCALRICNSLRALGIDSKMLVAQKSSDEPFVFVMKESGINTYSPPKNRVVRRIKKLLRKKGYFLTELERYQQSVSVLNDKAYFTFPLSKFDLATHPLVKEADIIHLHWVANFVDFPTFFRSIEKPIVWTLHDESIGLGGFHYQESRDRYYSLCKPTEDKLLQIKESAILNANSKIYLVAISRVMFSFCSRLSFFERVNVSLIHNGVDSNRFVPVEKEIAKSVLGIPSGHRVIAFCAQSLDDARKGLKVLVYCLEQLEMNNITLLCAGGGNLPIQSSSLNIIRLGAIGNERLLSLFYSCADLFVFPSSQESFGQTPLEAMSCGIPVVAFPCGVIPELINETNGVLCPDFTKEALLDGIKIAMNRKYDSTKIRKDVLERFSYNMISQQYVQLYNEITSNLS